jgi:hypothetical protein
MVQVWSSLRPKVLDIVVWRFIINMAHEYNLSMIEEIQLWRMYPSLRGSVEYLKLWAIHSPQESTRRHINTIIEALGRN